MGDVLMVGYHVGCGMVVEGVKGVEKMLLEDYWTVVEGALR